MMLLLLLLFMFPYAQLMTLDILTHRSSYFSFFHLDDIFNALSDIFFCIWHKRHIFIIDRVIYQPGVLINLYESI